MLNVAEAMSASMHWNFLAQYSNSTLKEMFADLRSIATTSSTEPMEEMEEEKSKGAEEEHGQSVAQGQTRHRPAGEQHIPFVILFILVYGRFMMMIQVNNVLWTRVLCMAAAWLCGC